MLAIIRQLLDDPTFKSQVKFTHQFYLANQKILEQGKRREHIYIIKKGKVKVSISSNKEEEKYVHPGVCELGPDETFGEFGLFEDKPFASADVIAITDCQLTAIDIPSFRNYLNNNPEVGYQILLAILNMLIKLLHHSDQTILSLYVWGMKAHKLDKFLNEEENEKK